MNIHSKIQKLRHYPEKLSIKKEIFYSVCIVLFGCAMGFISKMTDSVSLIGEIGTELGIWVFTAALIAAFSRYPFSAAINVFLFFISMLFAYYIYGYVVIGFFPRAYFVGWLFVALLSSFAGFCTWFSKAKGIVGSIVTALPVALLFAHGYPAFYTFRIALYLSLIMGIILCFALPQTTKYKIISLAISIPVALIIDKLYLIGYLPF